MATATLNRKAEKKLLRILSKREDLLSRFIEQATLLEGKKGRGKTFSTVGICYNLREMFNLPIIVVGSKMGLRPEFGPHEVISEQVFLEKLEILTDIAEKIDPLLGEVDIEKALRAEGVNFMFSVVVFDEAYKLFESRTPSDKVVRLFGYFVAQMRHYHMSAILCTPRADMIDKRVRTQMDHKGRCFMNKRRERCTVWLKGGGMSWRLRVDNKDQFGLRPDYYNMYNSWALLGFRRKHLDIQEV